MILQARTEKCGNVSSRVAMNREAQAGLITGVLIFFGGKAKVIFC